MRLLEVLNLVLVGGSKMSAQAPVVASDDGTAPSGRHVLVDSVFSVDTGFGAGLGEDIGVLVLANATNIRDGVGREDVLVQQLVDGVN